MKTIEAIFSNSGINCWMLFGIISGIAVGLVLALFLKRLMRGKWQLCGKYDERQTLAHGKAYRNAFWTLIGYLCLWLVLLSCGFTPSAFNSYIIPLVGILFGVVVYVVSCIMLDAYIGLNDNFKRLTITFLVLLIINLMLCFTGFLNHSSTRWLSLAAVIVLATVLTALGIKALLNKRQEEEEEE